MESLLARAPLRYCEGNSSSYHAIENTNTGNKAGNHHEYQIWYRKQSATDNSNIPNSTGSILIFRLRNNV